MFLYIGHHERYFCKCERSFDRPNSLAIHEKFCSLSSPKKTRKKKRKRFSYTLRFKSNCVAALREGLLPFCVSCANFHAADDFSTECLCGQQNCKPRVKYAYEVADEWGISPSLLSKWNNKQEIFFKLAEDRPKMQKLHSGTHPCFPSEEKTLYRRFIKRRKTQGLTVDSYWIRAEFKDILDNKFGKDKYQFNFSNGWVCNFLIRHRISNQMRTEKKYKSAMERLTIINEFHFSLAHIQRNHTQKCPIWGAYPPSNTWNADHVPMPFCVNLTRSLNPKNDVCWIAHVGASGLDKRQCTVHLCIRADGEQVVPPFLIFKNLGKISDGEREFLDNLKNINWAFQPKAWADGRYSRMWMRTFVRIMSEHDSTKNENHLLFLDDLKCQKSKAFNKIAIENNIFPFPIPPGLTDLLQPVDHHVGALLKRIMNGLYKVELELNYDMWRNYKNNASLAAPKRRMLLALWLDTAWSYMRKNPQVLEDSFSHTVFLYLLVLLQKKNVFHFFT